MVPNGSGGFRRFLFVIHRNRANCRHIIGLGVFGRLSGATRTVSRRMGWSTIWNAACWCGWERIGPKKLCESPSPTPSRSNGGQRSWSLAAGGLARAQHRTAQCLLRLARDSAIDCETHRLTRRTAGCGPACPVVWEGRSCEASPYPDSNPLRMNFLITSKSGGPEVLGTPCKPRMAPIVEH
jgi:hypothetical protein